MSIEEKLKAKIRNIPDFPKEGIIFRDITTLLSDPEGLKLTIDQFVQRYSAMDVDVVVGIEARGFILGGALAYKLDRGFVPVRKKGKLPFKTISHEYDLEYGTDTIEMHVDSIKDGDNVLIIDDLLATGGTSLAAAELVQKLGGRVVELAFIVDLPDVGGQQKIKDAGHGLFTLCEFEGE